MESRKLDVLPEHVFIRYVNHYDFLSGKRSYIEDEHPILFWVVGSLFGVMTAAIFLTFFTSSGAWRILSMVLCTAFLFATWLVFDVAYLRTQLARKGKILNGVKTGFRKGWSVRLYSLGGWAFPYPARSIHLQYQFYTPSGDLRMGETKLGYLNNVRNLPVDGTPVVVLYLTDNWFILL
jgi:hypothetical protein